MKNFAAETHAQEVSSESAELRFSLEAMAHVERLEEAARILNLACVVYNQPKTFSAERLLKLAMHGKIRLCITLPEHFHVHRKNEAKPFSDTPFRPMFPAGSDWLHLLPNFASEIYQAGGADVPLRRATCPAPDGTVDSYVAATPYPNISTGNLRIESEEIRRLEQDLLRDVDAASIENNAAASAPTLLDNFDISAEAALVAEAKHEVLIEEAACDGAGNPSESTATSAPELRENEYFDPNDSALTKTERKIKRIIWLAIEFGYSPTAIPDGGKKLLSEECRKRWRDLFGGGEHPFLEAWKESGDRLRMQNHDRYISK